MDLNSLCSGTSLLYRLIKVEILPSVWFATCQDVLTLACTGYMEVVLDQLAWVSRWITLLNAGRPQRTNGVAVLLNGQLVGVLAIYCYVLAWSWRMLQYRCQQTMITCQLDSLVSAIPRDIPVIDRHFSSVTGSDQVSCGQLRVVWMHWTTQHINYQYLVSDTMIGSHRYRSSSKWCTRNVEHQQTQIISGYSSTSARMKPF